MREKNVCVGGSIMCRYCYNNVNERCEIDNEPLYNIDYPEDTPCEDYKPL